MSQIPSSLLTTAGRENIRGDNVAWNCLIMSKKVSELVETESSTRKSSCLQRNRFEQPLPSQECNSVEKETLRPPKNKSWVMQLPE